MFTPKKVIPTLLLKVTETLLVGKRKSFKPANLSSPRLHQAIEIVQQRDQQVTRLIAQL